MRTPLTTPLFGLPLLALAYVASCDSAEPVTPLSERETVALLSVIVSMTEVDEPGTNTVTVDCSVGGEATVAATIEIVEVGDSTAASGRWTIVPADCEMDIVSDTLTLNGKPDVRLGSDYWAVFDDNFEFVKGAARLTASGAMTWRRRNGDTDTCPLDLTFESTEWDDDVGFTGDLKGRMCGLDITIDPNELDS
ncbi:MAG: hypothetical protein OXQ94_17845 [Gemmatimonadota bacterium]|nr:hypothetical protein [Gemmatimonadota bacterium]